MGAPIRILHLDDNPLDSQLVALTLEQEQEKLPTILQYVQTKVEYLAALKQKNFDLILSDYRMPGYDGDQALAAAQEICPEIPFIMVTGELGEELVIETLKRGATDYVLKDRIFRLVPAIKRALREAENKKKRVEAEAARERLVEELERRHGELLAIIQAMEGGVTVFDTKGDIVLVNEAEARMLGYTDLSELHHDLSDFASLFELKDAAGKIVPVEEWPFSRVMRGEVLVNNELSGRRKDTGREWFFSFSGRPVRDASGKQILSVVVSRDITERKQYVAKLRKAERTTGEILESVQDPIFGLDSQWCFTYVNTRAEEFMEKSRVELLGNNFWKLFPQLLGTESERNLRTVMESRKPEHREYKSVLKDIWISVHIFPKADGGLTVLYRDISGRKANEEALRLSQELFAATFMGSPYPLALSRIRDGLVLEVNEALLKLYGAAREEVVGKTTFQLGIWPDLRERERILEIIKREGKIYESETTLKTRTHEERRILVTVTLISAAEEPAVLSVLSDITERKRIEESLKESEELSRLALAVGKAGAWSWDLPTGRLRWSEEYYRVLGLDPGIIEPSAEAGLSRAHAEDRERVRSLVDAAVSSGEAIDAIHRVIWPDGSTHWVRGMAKAFFERPSDRKPSRLVGLATDVSAQIETEQRLHQLNQDLQKRNLELDAERLKWQRLMEGIADEVWACDLEGKVSVVNVGTRTTVGLMDFEGRSLKETLAEIEVFSLDGSARPDAQSPLQRSLQGEVLRGEEIVRNRRTGVTRIRQFSSAPVGDADGRVIGSVAVVRDVTEERQAEAKIRRLNEELEERVRERTTALERANHELEAFSYSVSHDLKAPLRLVNGFVNLLMQSAQANLSELQKDYLATIQHQASHMEDLIKALLDFARLARKELQRVAVDTRQLVEQVVAEQRQILGAEAGERVVVHIGDLPVVEADLVLLRVVFTNLLSNAFKFTRPVNDPTITIDATRKECFYSFRIRDNGVGFPKDQGERLFKVFQRLHGAAEFEGSGIGLANVRRIVEKHGGQVSGEGEEGKGATFYFTLPAQSPVTEASQDPMQ